MTGSTVQQFMTEAPYTIGHDQTLAAAHRIMRAHRIRHLPVLDSGCLVGIVSLRDLHLVETLDDVNPEEVPVSDAMSQETFTVSPRASVYTVAAEMAEHKYGCAVVLEKKRVIGVFTTVDALRALAALVDEHAAGKASTAR
jgi:acetoin utilization protein AcuB